MTLFFSLASNKLLAIVFVILQYMQPILDKTQWYVAKINII